MSTRVYVHIGLPKTGTTFVQSALWEGRAALAAAGCLVPGERRPAAWWAASDLLGRRPRGAAGKRIPGAWEATASAIRAWQGERAIFSEELLSIANRRQIRRLLGSLGDAEVHAVVTVRDLDRVLPSLWQQEIRKGRTWTWPEFLTSIRDPKHGSVGAAASFWMRYDLQKILSAWAAELSPDRIHVVVLPPAGAPTSTLLDRFAHVVGVDTALLVASAPSDRSNNALGAAEAEALRRLNVRLAGALNERQYVRAVVHGAIPALEARGGSTRVTIPTEHRDWVDKASRELVDVVRGSGYQVVGELDDLLRPETGVGTSGSGAADVVAEVDLSALAESALDALAGVSTAYAEHWWKRRVPEREAAGEHPGRIGSAARAASYGVKARTLDAAEHNRALRWLSLRYLGRSRRR